MPRLIAIIAAAWLFAGPTHAQTADPEPVIAAERAFAADALTMGVDRAFLKWAMPGAVLIAGGSPQPVEDLFDEGAVFDPATRPLVWWPNWAGIAASGDLGFTTGGVEVNGRRTGHYFTIWQRQADGTWRWVYDGGVPSSAADVPGPESELQILATSTVAPSSAEAALGELRAVEAVLAAAAAGDQKAAHLSLLAPDGRLYVGDLPPAIGQAAFPAALDAWPKSFDLSPPLGSGASAAGDLGWTYGRALWKDGDANGSGYYVHLWQKRETGWALAFAKLIVDPPAPPAPG
ncbi:hypothetical protein [Brevundimonas sp. AAP58]|uniref:hypothetical protein n=1 Tax=Brevundimonas sp. AAP58 TaxID=1523422 RepID=UPI0006B9EC86|nr:hypothetical protein [Brevundimonas sp. AAP58]